MTSKNEDQAGDEKYGAGEAAISTEQKKADTTRVSTRRTSLLTALKGGWPKTTAEIAGILSLVVAIIAIVVQPSGSFTTTPGVATSPQPGWQRTPTRAEITLFDDFSGSEIDPDKWTVNPHSSDNVLPYVKDEKLHLEVTRDTPKDDRGENHALLQAKLRRPITDVSFDMTMASRSGTNKGGGYANVSADNDREQKVALKSGNPGRDSPHLDYYICVETDCNNGAYRDFKHPNQHDIQVGTTHHVHIYYDNRGWIFQVDDLQPVITGSEDGPIENLSFSLFSSGEPFHITVADVRVGYA